MNLEESSEAQERRLKLELRLAQLERIESGQKNFLEFVQMMWPEFIVGNHHKTVAEKFQKIADGSLKRLIINMPPRHT